MTREDLRAAVQAGIVSEAQAASLKALLDAREGNRAAMTAEDEPFEFFKGFGEIFISLGLVILISGLLTLLMILGSGGALWLVPAATAAVTWWMAEYFTLRRRMTLPSMVLTVVFGGALIIAGYTWGFSGFGISHVPTRYDFLMPQLLAVAGLAVWYWRFRLPFAMFALGAAALSALYTSLVSIEIIMRSSDEAWSQFFDLGTSPVFATATLGFGLACFVIGMGFDMQDPHRLGRRSATAFWLHLLAAPALVNTVALSLYNNNSGMGLLILALVLVGVLALVIDRRSFLSAAIAYIAIVLTWALGDASGDAFDRWPLILMLLGAGITAVGTWWVQLRAGLMRALPDFPGKDRLPPYSRGL